MLGARGIEAHTLEENLGQLEKHISAILLVEERDVVVQFLTQGRGACMEPEPPSGTQPSGDGLDLTRQVFLAAILRGQRQAAINIVEEALRAGHSHIEIYVNVFAEALRSVGELWELNKISVAEEHIATSITQYAIVSIYPRLVPTSASRGQMVVTGVSGELHQIGANLVADSMEANGWEVRFLGTNLPHSSILGAVKECSADVLCISTTILANLPSVAELVRTVRDKLQESAPKIVLGGAAHRFATQFAKEIGAMEAITDLRQGVAMLCGPVNS
jgi:MerR family transcriptional regulator, light-induced transcriptional regulator